MPSYVLICLDCEKALDEVIMPVREREKLRCDCGGALMNDYSRQKTSSFQLKGTGWPGKDGSTADRILRERNLD